MSPPSPESDPVSGPPLTIDDFDALALDFEGGGAYVTADGRGICGLPSIGEARGEVGIDGPGLYPLVETGRHGSHKLGIELEGAPEMVGRLLAGRDLDRSGLTIGRPLRISFPAA